MAYILSGTLKGMRLAVPSRIRTTEAKVRLALFNIIQSMTEGARALDGCAGSGALGLEALSRGAASAVFIDADTASVRAIRENVARACDKGLQAEVAVLKADVLNALRRLGRHGTSFDLVLLDPPYGHDVGKKALNVVAEYAMLAPAGILCVEHETRAAMPSEVGSLALLKQHRYGGTVLSFYQVRT
ncbi:MAG: 16S rRNA (guanine(966)-N(2))-methyltransferase RsmD [Candidatus Omnitrophica bacterium]|nr:16S rRNA (guanine(966)-N(2))-methyltransferase RsmD [Candidatus Omnitrophota bacterium]